MPIRLTQSTFGGVMNWQDFFKLKVSKSGEVFFAATLALPEDFAMHELIMSRFDHLKLTSTEKKKLSLGLRKILVCHDVFKTKEFNKNFFICEFKNIFSNR
jgi:hypothetical protein